MKIRLIASTIFTSATLIVGSISAPAVFADTASNIAGNGFGSTNDLTSTNSSSNTVVQQDTASISNNVTVNANTGGNNANMNTGGDTSILTGDATSQVLINNKANQNLLNLGGTSSNNAPTTLQELGNGASSTNFVSNSNTSANALFQNNNAAITNNVSNNLNTGRNNANQNTGWNGSGNVSILTGDASSGVGIGNAANNNWVDLNSSLGNSSGDVSSLIKGNGASSDNHITSTRSKTNSLVQGNTASIANNVRANLTTGQNGANQNTGGSEYIGTGNAGSLVRLNTLANLNAISTSSFDPGTDTLSQILGNGALSTNTVSNASADVNSIFQGGNGAGNLATITNGLTINPYTGNNNNNRNTSWDNGNSTVMTGGSLSQAQLQTTTNQNLIGINPTDLQFGFNLGDMLGMF